MSTNIGPRKHPQNPTKINSLKSRKSRIIKELKKGEIVPGSETALELYRELIEIEDELEKIE